MQKMHASLEEISRRYRPFYRARGVLMVPAFLLMTFCYWHECQDDWLQLTWGLAFFLAGWALRIWAQMHLRYRLPIKTILTTTGPYAHVRNPIYIANTLILVGICILEELIWLVPVVIGFCAVVYTLVVRYEEAHLKSKYGERYIEYLHRVPRWLPIGTSQAPPQCGGAGRFLVPSLRTEAHNVLWLVIPFTNEIIEVWGYPW